VPDKILAEKLFNVLNQGSSFPKIEKHPNKATPSVNTTDCKYFTQTSYLIKCIKEKYVNNLQPKDSINYQAYKEKE